MADKESNVILKYSVDRNSLEQALRSTETIESALNEIGGEAAKSSKYVAGLGDQIKNIKRIAAIDSIAREMATLATRTGDATSAAEGLRNALADVGATEGEIKRATLAFNAYNKQSSGSPGGVRLNNVAQVASGLGLGDAANVAGLADDFSELAGSLTGTGASLTSMLSVAAAAAPAIGLLALGIDNFKKSTEASSRALEGLIAGQEDYYRFISTATTDDIESRIQAEQQNIAVLKAARGESQKILDQIFNQLVDEQLKGGANPEIAKIVASGWFERMKYADGPAKAAREAIEKYNAEIAKQEGLIGRLNGDLQSNAVAVSDLIQATRNKMDAEREYNNIVSQGHDAVKRHIAAIEEENKIRSHAVSDLIKELGKEVGNGAPTVAALNGELKDLSPKAQALVIEINKLRDASSEARQRIAEFSGALAIGGFFADIRKGIDLIGDSASKFFKATQTFGAAVAAADERLFQERSAIQQRYNDRLIEAAKQAAEAAVNALRNLQEAQAKARTDYERNELQARIEFQRNEVKEYRDHQRRLQQIRDDAARRDYEFALARDFKSLFFSQLDTTKALNEENAQFIQDQQDRREQYQNERQDRLAAYQQALIDAQTQHAKEIALAQQRRQQAVVQAEQQKNAELSIARQKYNEELALRRRALQQELNLVSQGVKDRIRLESSAINNIVKGATIAANFISSIFSLLSGKKPTGKADGGYVSTGNSYIVDEPWSSRRESITSGGRTAMFPGMGLFIPTAPGYVNANKGNGGNTYGDTNIYINGAQDPRAVAREVRAEFARLTGVNA